MADPIPQITYTLYVVGPRANAVGDRWDLPQRHDNDRPIQAKYLTVPLAWKVTFGPLIPGSKHDAFPCVRIYEGKVLRGVIPNVTHLMTEGVRLEDVHPERVLAIEAPRRARRRVANRVD
jgi:hypothetical protein